MKTLLLLCTLCTSFGIGLCQTAAKLVSPPSRWLYEPTAWMGWTRISRFAPGDAPYTALRKRLEQQFRVGKSPLVLLKSFEPRIKGKNPNPLDLFGAALCVLQNDYASQTETQQERESRSEALLQLVEKAPRSPSNYEYVRMRFLLESSARGGPERNEKILPVAQLLLKKQPNDLNVEFEHAALLNFVEGVPVEKARAHFLRLMKKYPALTANFKSMLATSYATITAQQSDQAAFDKEIALRREVLAIYKKRPATVRNLEKIASAEENIQDALQEKADMEKEQAGSPASISTP